MKKFKARPLIVSIIDIGLLSFMSCNNAGTVIINRGDSINQKENNIKVMLEIIKKDYPDGKNRIMDSTKNAFEKRIRELDSLKSLK